MKHLIYIIITGFLIISFYNCSTSKSDDSVVVNKDQAKQEAIKEINDDNAEKIADDLLKELQSE